MLIAKRRKKVIIQRIKFLIYKSLPIGKPHQIVIDLGEKQKITGFRYLPRAEKGAPGQIRKYKIYIYQTVLNFR